MSYPQRQASTMSSYTAQLEWQRDPLEAFTDNRYSRRHLLRFDGGAEVPGSSSPHVVPLPMSDASAVDPEELFVASLAAATCCGSCRSRRGGATRSTVTRIKPKAGWRATARATWR
jgi:hypothetical protein